PVAISLLFLFIISAAAPTAFYTLSLHDALPILRVLPVPVAPAIKPCLFIIFNARFTFAAAMTCPSSRPAPKNMYAPFGLYDVLRSEEHTSELQSRENLVCRLLLEKKNNRNKTNI